MCDYIISDLSLFNNNNYFYIMNFNDSEKELGVINSLRAKEEPTPK